jgi:hypothetical protein
MHEKQRECNCRRGLHRIRRPSDYQHDHARVQTQQRARNIRHLSRHRFFLVHADAYSACPRTRGVNRFTWDANPMSDNRKFWWSELSKWDNRVERDWVQWIELVAGLFAMIVLTLSLLAVWDGNPR